MSETTLGLSFRETMSGGFALGETDPRAGQEAGKMAGTTLAMHASIHIRDLDTFVSEADHGGDITGHIDFSPFGQNIPASTGVFNLFSPTDDPKTKYMVYELAFQHDGQDYYLSGKKEVRDTPGIDLWPDTTTLYTTLHKGTDNSGEVVGAGVLGLSPVELAKLVSTVNVTDADSVIDQAAAIAKFGRFFMGELWDSYGRTKVDPESWWQRFSKWINGIFSR